MSWQDIANNLKLKVVTGEGSEFFPLYKGISKSRDMNASVFEFNNVEGALVRRGKVSSLKFPFEFHFQGSDNLDESDRFDIASKDQRPWTVTIPEYGDVLVQPVILNFNNKSQNVTIVSGELVETIPDTFPDSSIEVQARVLELVNLAAINLSLDFESVGIAEPQLTAIALTTITEMGDKFSLEAVTDFDLAAVLSAVNGALAALDNITNEAAVFMARVAELARTPAKFLASVQDRISIIEEAYEDVKSAVEGLQNIQISKYFEGLGGLLTIAKAESGVIPIDEIADEQGEDGVDTIDYRTRNDVLIVSQTVNNGLNDYLTKIGELTSEVDATPDSYTPTVNGVAKVEAAINEATGQLLQIAVGSKQERIYTVPEDIAIIPLAHRLLGTVDSLEIQNFVEANELLLDEILQVPKGRQIIYFV